jgi:hypothetical protein
VGVIFLVASLPLATLQRWINFVRPDQFFYNRLKTGNIQSQHNLNAVEGNTMNCETCTRIHSAQAFNLFHLLSITLWENANLLCWLRLSQIKVRKLSTSSLHCVARHDPRNVNIWSVLRIVAVVSSHALSDQPIFCSSILRGRSTFTCHSQNYKQHKEQPLFGD